MLLTVAFVVVLAADLFSLGLLVAAIRLRRVLDAHPEMSLSDAARWLAR